MSRGVVELCVVAVVGMMAWTWFAHRADRKRTVIMQAFTAQWARAVELGASAAHKPIMRFVDYGPVYRGKPFATTRCTKPYPTIEINGRWAVREVRFARRIAAPHEMAHVLVCLKGTGSNAHGAEWRTQVRRLVEPRQADAILQYQRISELPKRGDWVKP